MKHGMTSQRKKMKNEKRLHRREARAASGGSGVRYSPVHMESKDIELLKASIEKKGEKE